MKEIISEKDIEALSGLFKVLGDQTRIKILSVLKDNELCVNEISEKLNLSVSAISHQLNTLKIAKLVKSRREGKNIYYSLDDDHVNILFKNALEHIKHR
ncbi:ArsR/SmtB family transcription factor [Deferribacter abyssi]|uniref:ArsR/SmtB family transcription factor n=1 Tax=Deferribacter abyssi TaxID=213806 RepID=UPI003C17BC6B